MASCAYRRPHVAARPQPAPVKNARELDCAGRSRPRARAQLCVTCRIVRPLRAKHCAASDRCIEQFDHFCPWVGNAIGRRNRALFLAFLWLELGALGITAAVGALRLHAAARRGRPGSAVAWSAAFLVVDCFLALSVGALAVTQARRRRRPPDFEPVAPPARPPAHAPLGGRAASSRRLLTQRWQSRPLPDPRVYQMSWLRLQQAWQRIHLPRLACTCPGCGCSCAWSRRCPSASCAVPARRPHLMRHASCAQATQVARNITTNEMANWPRYRYLRAPDQSFANPFDRGWRHNCLDALFPDEGAAPGVVLHDAKP